MKSTLLILFSGSLLAVTACNKHDDSATSAGADTNLAIDNGAMDNGMAMNTVAEAAPLAPLTAQGFINAAAASDKFEIETSKLAATNGASGSVKSFADKMITAHTMSSEKLKKTVAAMGPPVTPDDRLTAQQQSTLDSLKGMKGADFDKAYAAAQVDGHQKTLDTLKGYSSSGDNATLKSFADGLIPTVTAHLNMAKSLR